MAGQQEIIKEYLVKVGFIVDKQAQKEFKTGIEDVDKAVKFVGKGIMAAATAAIALATSFANSMDKLYYASQKAGSAAGNLKALEYAGRQIGMTAEAVDQMVTSMSMALRMNPGKFGLLEQLGVHNAQTRQGVDVFMELMDKLHDKPMYEGAQFAEMLGVSPDQLFQIETNINDFHQKFQDRLKMAKDMGLDQDAAALAGRNLANTAGKALEEGDIARDRAGAAAAPTLISAAAKLDEAGSILLRAVRGENVSPEEKKVIKEDFDNVRAKVDQYNPVAGASLNAADTVYKLLTRQGLNQNVDRLQARATMGALEKQYGLDPGTLDHIWQRESARGDPKHMLSAAGAKGHFGFMDDTAKQYDVADPYDFYQSSRGAAKYMAYLKHKYGNTELAEQAYNWGPGNMDRYLGDKAKGKNPSMPKETQDYAKPTQNITINVNGAKSPAETASAVVRKIDTAAADLARYATGAVR